MLVRTLQKSWTPRCTNSSELKSSSIQHHHQIWDSIKITNLDVIFCCRKHEFFNVFSTMIMTIRLQKNQLLFRKAAVTTNIQELKDHTVLHPQTKSIIVQLSISKMLPKQDVIQTNYLTKCCKIVCLTKWLLRKNKDHLVMADEFSINIFIMSSFYKLLKLNPYVLQKLQKKATTFLRIVNIRRV
jgi:ribosomal protein L31E